MFIDYDNKKKQKKLTNYQFLNFFFLELIRGLSISLLKKRKHNSGKNQKKKIKRMKDKQKKKKIRIYVP